MIEDDHEPLGITNLASISSRVAEAYTALMMLLYEVNPDPRLSEARSEVNEAARRLENVNILLQGGEIGKPRG